MLPGFLLMFFLSWLYVRFGLTSPLFGAVFAGFQPAVAALIFRAVHRIGQHALTNGWLWGIAAGSSIAQLLGLNFFLTLLLSGALYLLIKRGWRILAAAVVFATALGGALLYLNETVGLPATGQPSTAGGPAQTPDTLDLFIYGLRSGLLTFGGAYTVIPFLQRDAVIVGGFMSNQQFLDGLALSGILPAPLIIFSTFVGYLGGGALGALALTLGIFLPAFSFTLIGHELLEKLVETPAIHTFLDGVTAGVIGLITVTALGLARVALTSPAAWLIFAASLFLLYRWKAKETVIIVVLGAGLLGLLLLR